GQSVGHVYKILAAGEIHVLHFQGLREALCLRIVIGVADGFAAAGIENDSQIAEACGNADVRKIGHYRYESVDVESLESCCMVETLSMATRIKPCATALTHSAVVAGAGQLTSFLPAISFLHQPGLATQNSVALRPREEIFAVTISNDHDQSSRSASKAAWWIVAFPAINTVS
ncbi:MAG: hypothetical protein ACT6WE_28545, partial [Shinella sp.]|uniref:hypothetical protein n=1 Tax=Shinella sp. TaxID=1870904 RepID=UPI0040370CB2